MSDKKTALVRYKASPEPEYDDSHMMTIVVPDDCDPCYFDWKDGVDYVVDCSGLYSINGDSYTLKSGDIVHYDWETNKVTIHNK